MLKYQSPFARPIEDEKTSFSMFGKERKADDLEIRTPSDVAGKQLLEGKKAENSLGYKLREKYLPELPGYKPDKLVNRYQLETYLEKLLETRVQAQLVSHRIPGALVSAVVGTIFQERAPWRVVRRCLDVFAEAKRGETELKQQFNYMKIGYLELQHRIMMAERRDWQNYRQAEQERGYVAPNRMEWWGLLDSLTSIHQDVRLEVGKMDKFIREVNARVDGASARRQVDIFAPLVSGVLREAGTPPAPARFLP